jgi:hypothetical protein
MDNRDHDLAENWGNETIFVPTTDLADDSDLLKDHIDTLYHYINDQSQGAERVSDREKIAERLAENITDQITAAQKRVEENRAFI